MNKLWIIPLVLIILVIAVDAKCGDSFCDPNENCTSCADDCLCTKDEHNEPVNCSIAFTSVECQEGYCHDRWCNSLEGFVSIFQKTMCSDNGSVSMEIKFLELGSVTLTPGKNLKAYMKQGEESTFEEINGVWENPSMEGEFKHTQINGISKFLSDTGLFKTKGDYYVRVKYTIGKSSSIFEDVKISCPGMTEPVTPAEKPAEEKPEEVVEKPAETPAEKPAETPTAPPKETAKEPEKKPKSNLLWYVIIGVIILGMIIFFVRYELKVIRRIQ